MINFLCDLTQSLRFRWAFQWRVTCRDISSCSKVRRGLLKLHLGTNVTKIGQAAEMKLHDPSFIRFVTIHSS